MFFNQVQKNLFASLMPVIILYGIVIPFMKYHCIEVTVTSTILAALFSGVLSVIGRMALTIWSKKRGT